MMKQIGKVSFLLVVLLLAACNAATETAVTAEIVAGNETSTVAETIAETTSVASATATPPQINLPDLGVAPEITNDVWINSDAPVTLASQQGKVVLLEFWTFG